MYILIANLINTILQEIIGLSVLNGGDRKSAAIATVVLFVLVAVIIFGGLFVVNLVYILVKYRKKNNTVKILLLIGQAVGALCYFYGNNIGNIFVDYGAELNCGQECIINNSIAATIASGVALLLFIEFPPCMHKIAKLHSLKDNTTGWFAASGMIALFIKLDALYNTVVIATADIDDFCNREDVAINTIFLIICIITGTVLIIINGVYSVDLLKKSEHKHYTWVVYVALVLLLLCLPLFLLTDNAQPLDCAFNCDSFSKNQTLQIIECDQESSSGVRLSLSMVILAVVSSLSFLLLCCKHNTKGEGVV